MEDLGPFTLPYTRTYDFVAKSNGRAYRVFVSTPSGKPPDKPLPVLYALDGNAGFGTVVETARWMAFGGEIEPMVIVGIGYPTMHIMEAMVRRTYELSPSYDAAFVERAKAEGQPLPAGGLGGAPGFLSFIDEELAPFVEAEYAGGGLDRGLFGFSLGGLFATHALLQPQPVFQRYIIGSPSLWWNEREMFALEKQRAEAGGDLPAKVFLSAAELEESPGAVRMAPFRMVSNAIEMGAMLGSRGYEGLDIRTHIFPGESHQSAIGPTVARGLRVLYGV
jgi:predicted alpha/beta superfamily hydrolase